MILEKLKYIENVGKIISVYLLSVEQVINRSMTLVNSNFNIFLLLQFANEFSNLIKPVNVEKNVILLRKVVSPTTCRRNTRARNTLETDPFFCLD